MTDIVSFTGLGLSFEINRVAFSIGKFDVYWYGLLIGLGMLIAFVYAMQNANKFGVDVDRMLDVVLVGAIFGIVGSRLYYVIFAEKGEFTSFFDIIDIRNGGLAFYGTVIGAAVAALIMCPLRKVKLFPMLDISGIGLLIGQCVGRWGNFFNQEAFGCNTNLPWGMTSSTVVRYLTFNADTIAEHGMSVDPLAAVHPTFLYESIWYLIGTIILVKYAKKRKFDGEIALIYLAWNGAGRAVFEGLRTDSLYLGSIRISQLLAILGFVASVAVIIIVRTKIKKSDEPSRYIPYGNSEEWAKELSELNAERDGKAKADDAGMQTEQNDVFDDEAERELETDESAEPAQPERELAEWEKIVEEWVSLAKLVTVVDNDIPTNPEVNKDTFWSIVEEWIKQ